MPVYHFKCPQCGRREQAVRPVENRNMPLACNDCDSQMRRDIGSEQRSVRACPGNWPMFSDALGCHESQIPESMEVARKNGVPTEFTPDGRAILTSPAHRRAYARLYGFHDRNGGYSDP